MAIITPVTMPSPLPTFAILSILLLLPLQVLLGLEHFIIFLLPLWHFNRIRTRRIPNLWWQSKRLGYRIFFGQFDPPDLVSSFAGLALILGFVGIGALGVAFGIPRQISSLRPSSDGSFQRMAEVILAML
jgi:hypothetical protein